MIEVKRGDVGIVFTDQLTAQGEPVNLTTADTVRFLLRRIGSSVLAVASEDVDITDAPGGGVSYTTVDGDLDQAGIYHQEWEVEFENGDRFTWPSDTHNVVAIVGDLNQDPEEGS